MVKMLLARHDTHRIDTIGTASLHIDLRQQQVYMYVHLALTKAASVSFYVLDHISVHIVRGPFYQSVS